MEEKKNNKVLIVGLILILVLCLVYTLFFMYKMVSSSDNNSNETSNTKINNNEETEQTGQFTELTKYELEEGEEEEITIEGKKVIFKYQDKKMYINGKEVGNQSTFIITNKLIIFSVTNQFSTDYDFYDLNANKIEEENFSDYRLDFEGLYLKEGKLLTKARNNPTEWEEGQVIANLITEPCDIAQENSKKLSEYENVVKEHENDIIQGIYEIKYENNKMILELYERIQTVKEYLEGLDLNSICAIEKNS